jgi:hypothetical protein
MSSLSRDSIARRTVSQAKSSATQQVQDSPAEGWSVIAARRIAVNIAKLPEFVGKP